jgi:PmbA protein
LEETLSQAKRVADEAEVFCISHQRASVIFQANRLKELNSRQSTMTTLRLIKDGKVGLASATKPGSDLVNRAVEVSELGQVARLELPRNMDYPQVEVYDPAAEMVTTEEMVKLGESLVAEVLEHTPELLCGVEVTKDLASVHILNSRGLEASYKKSISILGVEGTLIRDQDMLFVGDGESSCHPIRDTGQITGSVKRQLEMATAHASTPTGEMPAIFTPRGIASALVAPLALAFNGKMVLRRASPLWDKRGKQVFDQKLRLYDSAILGYCPPSRPCDDEGVASRQTPLVEEGVVANFLYDLQTAAMARTESTGNGSRAGRGAPAPSVNALILEEGDTSFEDMVRDMKKGLVIEQVMGAEQGNILGGDFSGNVLLGCRVDGGEVTGRVKDTMIFGNVYQILSQVLAAGNKSRWVGGMLRTPAIYCPSLAVASKGA